MGVGGPAKPLYRFRMAFTEVPDKTYTVPD
jgi:hypothetical protein